jgi:hypothetical protein
MTAPHRKEVESHRFSGTRMLSGPSGGSGALKLPRFGAYRARIRMAHRQPSILRVVLPLTIER